MYGGGGRAIRRPPRANFFAHGAMSSVTRVISAAAWCDDVPSVERVDLIEHAKADPDLGTVLSLLAMPEDVQEDRNHRTRATLPPVSLLGPAGV